MPNLRREINKLYPQYLARSQRICNVKYDGYKSLFRGGILA
jgi:hypothetical protein